MKTIEVKTKYKGLVWIHQKYIAYLKSGESLTIKHQDKKMTITPGQLVDFKKGSDLYEEKYGPNKGEKYCLYGFSFRPDFVKKKKTKEKNQILAQCPDCLNCLLKVKEIRRFKEVWQGSVVEFKNVPCVQCPTCKHRDSGIV